MSEESDFRLDDKGFTLIELLVSAAIISILSAMAISAYGVYKKNAYHKIAMQMMTQTRTALEAGLIDSESFPEGTIVIDQTDAGPVAGADGELLLPGLILPESTRVYARYNTTCDDPGCLEVDLLTRHCKADSKVTYQKFHQGVAVTIYNAAEAAACT